MGRCEEVLKLSKKLGFLSVYEKDTLSDKLVEWFKSATYEEYMEKTNGGIDVTIPVEDIIPIGVGGTYSKEQFEQAKKLVDQGRYKKLTKDQELAYVQKNIGVVELADKYVHCVNNEENSRVGLHLSTVTNEQDILVTVWWIPATAFEDPPEITSCEITGATYTNDFPIGLEIQPSGYSIILQREENKPVSIAINTTKGAVSGTVSDDIEDGLGKKWIEREGEWVGEWTRRGLTNNFDAKFSKAGESGTSFLTILRDAQNNVSVIRRDGGEGTQPSCVYSGTIADDGETVTGTFKCHWNPDTLEWRASILND